ncbi:MAG TPA: VTT domain-containing protein [Desulfuromonadales bacterium]|nr:VTT domain-containing protein [Desulfuromonadales bacterium]
MRFSPGENCWRAAEAGRIAFLVDGQAYFRAVAEACEAARQCIHIIGWDMDSRLRLRRDEEDGELFGDFLDRLARETEALQIYLLEWDFSMLYSLEREILPLLSFGWKTHDRVRFALDNEHPVGASHHQKIVVVDDQVAFVGGFDFALCRWDTSEHAPDDHRRRDNGESYGPFHDIQMLVDGKAAVALGDLARHRWEQANGESLPTADANQQDCWPASVDPELENAKVAILRTEPKYAGRSEVDEIERFYKAAIEQGEKTIYIENQYLTSHVIGQALEKSLKQKQGPEILILQPKKCSGWLEEETMGRLRHRLLSRLNAADHQNRLKVCYPDRTDLGGSVINVHSKIILVDDSLLSVGSANLNNRSMGFDSECNLALSVAENEAVADLIVAFRQRLLAEHLGIDPQRVAETFQKTGSLLATVEELNGGRRYLQDLPYQEDNDFSADLPAGEIADPEQPLAFDDLLDHLGLGKEIPAGKDGLKYKAWRFGAVLVSALVLAAVWRWSPLKEWVNLDTILAVADKIRQSTLTLPIVLGIYLIGSCLMFPITLMILATALTFGPVEGFLYALAGSLLGGLASFLLGRWLGRDVVAKLAGTKLNRLSRRLAKRGWLPVAVVRVVPIAPFTIVNLVAGSTHISTGSFIIGTTIGMSPGILAIMVFEGGLEQALRDPDFGSITLAVGALIIGALVLLLGKRWLMGKEEEIDE